MSIKSILLSILSLILYAGMIVGIVFLFRVQFIVGLIGIIALIIPFLVQRKAIGLANGKFDKFFSKYIIPTILAVALVFVVLYFTLWN